ncbi:MAG: heavy metal-binding domain-containing protein, partial [Candidatus Omnitrophica bacterium]|nr:heavy metal-binding domain-containing protein [Candidatus Omnitrophota bacterium]
MIVVNTETIPGMRIVQVRGIVQGNTVRSKHMGRDIMAGFKNLVGGELKGYTELLTEARREALSRMLSEA